MTGCFGSRGAGNHAVIGKVNRRIVPVPPASRRHLMPDEGNHRYQETSAHNQRRHQDSQVLQHARPLPGQCLRGGGCLPALVRHGASFGRERPPWPQPCIIPHRSAAAAAGTPIPAVGGARPGCAGLATALAREQQATQRSGTQIRPGRPGCRTRRLLSALARNVTVRNRIYRQLPSTAVPLRSAALPQGPAGQDQSASRWQPALANASLARPHESGGLGCITQVQSRDHRARQSAIMPNSGSRLRPRHRKLNGPATLPLSARPPEPQPAGRAGTKDRIRLCCHSDRADHLASSYSAPVRVAWRQAVITAPLPFSGPSRGGEPPHSVPGQARQATGTEPGAFSQEHPIPPCDAPAPAYLALSEV